MKSQALFETSFCFEEQHTSEQRSQSLWGNGGEVDAVGEAELGEEVEGGRQESEGVLPQCERLSQV